MFASPMLNALDTRYDYGEDRWLGIGLLQGRIVVIVYTYPDAETLRVVSLRKAVSHERKRFAEVLKNRLG